MNTYVWKITDMKANGEGGVTSISWECLSTAEDGRSYTATGLKEYTPDSSTEDFTPLADLSESTVLEWVWRFFHKQGIEEHCDASLAYQANLNVMSSVTLPWIQEAE
jgi:hypothetical protein